MLVSEWANARRHLSPEASAEPGQWQNDRAPHLIAPMDALAPYDPAERVVGKFSSQTGKTEVILNLVGYVMDLDPGPILAIQPNVTPMGERFSKQRIAPMLRDSPVLATKVGNPKSRISANTILEKQFPGGQLFIGGANSPAGLASMPIRYLVCDEIDRWEVTKEGDPLLLARKRMQTFRARRRSKELLVSSPTYDDIGISAEYAKCTQQFEWHLQCQHCGETQMPLQKHFSCDDHDASTVRYACEHCGGLHDLGDEHVVKASGRWVCVKDGPRVSVGYWMNQFASPFARWDDTWQEWLDALGDAAKMQVVTNTVFACGWEGEGEKADPHVLQKRAEVYAAEVPDGVCAITMGADVQQDRIEVEVVGWNANRESWSIDYQVLPGEPSTKEVWDDLLDLFRTGYKHSNGAIMSASMLCVDSGAFTQHVYDFVKDAKDRRIVPIKGVSGMNREQIDPDERLRQKRIAKRLRTGKPAEMLGVDSIKVTVMQYLAAQAGSRGYCHFPEGRGEEYYLQLTGERLVPVQRRGHRPTRAWKPIHSNVEALDCRVYAYAAALLYGFNKMRAPAPPKKPTQTDAKPTPPRRSSFVSGWRR